MIYYSIAKTNKNNTTNKSLKIRVHKYLNTAFIRGVKQKRN